MSATPEAKATNPNSPNRAFPLERTAIFQAEYEHQSELHKKAKQERKKNAEAERKARKSEKKKAKKAAAAGGSK